MTAIEREEQDPAKEAAAASEDRADPPQPEPGVVEEHAELGEVDTAAAEVVSDGSAELEELRRELEYVNDRHLRLAAEFDNYRRRAQAQLGESGVRAQADLIGAFLDVLDDLRRVSAVDSGTASVESVLEGVSLLERKLLQTLEEAGLEELDPGDEPFDPNTMEALGRSPAESEEEDDTVGQVVQRGFRFRGRLVRPARVMVRKYQ